MAGKVINFGKRKEELANKIPKDIDEWLRYSTNLLSDADFLRDKKKIDVSDMEQLKKRIEVRITEKIIQTRNISTGVFHCGLYVSQLLSKFITDSPENWCLVDYLEKYEKSKNPFFLQEAGDVCFLVCTAFFKKDKASYYKIAGAGFYYNYYALTEKEIGHLMSQNFETMAKITNSCLQCF